MNRCLLLVSLSLSVGLIACAEPEPASEPLRVADPQRVVALAPSIVELIYELELGDRLVGVGEYCKWPAEVAGLPKVGGLLDPNLEKITRLEPDLAVLLPSEERSREHLEALGIEVLTVSSESLADVEQSALTLASRFGVEDRGKAFAERWREALAPRPLSSSPRVLLAVSRQHGDLSDTLSVGPGTFYDELLQRMGAVNIFEDAPTRYPQVNLEEVMQRLPEAIIDLRAGPPTDRLTVVMREDWQQLAGVPALDRGCYHLIGGDYVMLPGPRLPQLYRELREALQQCGF